MVIVFDAKRNTLEMRKYPARMSREIFLRVAEKS